MENPPPTQPVTPLPPAAPSETRNWLMGLHLSPIVAFWIGGVGAIIAPLIIWLIKKDGNPEINAQGKQALNFQISFALYFLICGLLISTFLLAVLGAPLLLAAGIVWLYGMIKAAMDVNNGVSVKYPFAIPFLK